MQSSLPRRLLRSPWLYVVVAGGAVLLILGLLAATWLYDHDDRVRFRLQSYWASFQDTIDPQPQFAPTAVAQVGLSTLPATPTTELALASTPTASPTVTATSTPLPGPTSTPEPTLTPSPSPTPLPGKITLTGFAHEYQLFNNCGPTSLKIDLSYWGWSGTQKQAAAVLKPNPDDKNVSPRELYEYALTQGYDAYIRVNGDLETVKRFVAAGYPVILEKGFTCVKGESCTGWFGHYSVVVGFDDEKQVVVLQDSYRGPNISMSYADIVLNWRAFNYLYLVFFPQGAEYDAAVQGLLGGALDVTANYNAALERALQEAQTSTGEQAAFAWYNVGTNRQNLQDYAGAATAYDQARAIGLPYRMLWYQFGPYTSYYYTGRYQDVIDLATFAIDSVNTVPGLEEAYYWRGLAEAATNQPEAAAEDLRTALERHPGYQPAIDALAQLGLAP
jgi:tetratricopeptide (TPR) repeat protein